MISELAISLIMGMTPTTNVYRGNNTAYYSYTCQLRDNVSLGLENSNADCIVYANTISNYALITNDNWECSITQYAYIDNSMETLSFENAYDRYLSGIYTAFDYSQYSWKNDGTLTANSDFVYNTNNILMLDLGYYKGYTGTKYIHYHYEISFTNMLYDGEDYDLTASNNKVVYGQSDTLHNEQSYNTGYTTGYNNGYDTGYDTGYTTGYNNGYQEGYDYSENLDDYSVQSMLTTILDYPLKLVKQVTNVELFGVNLYSVITFVISISLVAFVIKYFI